MSRLAGINSRDNAFSKAGKRLFFSRSGSPLILPTKPFCADTGYTCVSANPSVCATLDTCRLICCSTSNGERSSSHMLSILFSTTMRPAPLPI